MEIKAFIFDMNGTMIDDMQYHARAWYDILNNDLNAGLTWHEVKAQMYGKNAELLDRIFGKDHFSPERVEELSIEKETRYQKEYLPHIGLVKGFQEFLERSEKAGIPMGIGTAAITFNIDFILDNLHLRHFFKAIVSADDVAASKPDPETFIRCAELMQVPTMNCLVFEDAPQGIEAAQKAGMKCVALTTMHSKEEFEKYSNVISFVQDYSQITPAHFVK